jgi:predicted Zn-dependent protease
MFERSRQFQFRQSTAISQMLELSQDTMETPTEGMDKITRLKEILALDPRNSFARYGIAMELAARGQTEASLKEFDALLSNDPEYTAGYYMSAQTLSKSGRTAEAIERLKTGISCAARNGNSHALSEMQSMLDELAR